MNEKNILKYISGNASDEERLSVLDWIEQSEDNRAIFSKIKNAWVMSRLPQTPPSETEIKRFSARLRRRQILKHTLQWGVAAGIAIILSVTAYQKVNYYESQIDFLKGQDIAELEYSTNKGIKGKITLPDGSIVWLNSASRLKCPSRFSGDFRTLEFSGEGFFDVVHNPEKPMTIHLDNDITVMVKGTRFNLSSYKNDKDVSALLLSGEITIVKNNKNRKEEIFIKPNEKIFIAKSNKLVNTIEPKEFLSTIGWKEGWLIFNDTPMEEVLKKLERWHGVQFVIEDANILNQKFTARFKEESISQILELMNQISLLSYELNDTTVTLKKY